MEKKINEALTFRDVYRRHKKVWNTLAFFAFVCMLLVGYGAYLVWFVPLGSTPVISGYVIGKIIIGALIGWVLTAIAQRK